MEFEDYPSILLWYADQQGDAHLFPREVVDLHMDGKPHTAFKALRRATRRERHRDRKAAMRRAQEQHFLWAAPLRSAPSMFTLNGFGLRLVGSTRGDDEGYFVKTLWITALFVPLVPLGAYLVTHEGDGWLFHGRSPMPKGTRLYRTGVVAVGVLAALGIGSASVMDVAQGELLVVNGFDVPITVQADGVDHVIASGDVTALTGGMGTLEVTTRVGDEVEPLETVDVDLFGSGWSTVVYNPGNRGVIQRYFVRYGDEEPSEEGMILPAERVVTLAAVDYPFEVPPDSKRLSSRTDHIDNDVLELWAPGDVDVAHTAAYLSFELGMTDHARELLVASLHDRPEDDNAIRTLLTLFPDAARPALAAAREREGTIVVHRAWQDLHSMDGADPVLAAEYRARTNARPDDPDAWYLAGRLVEDSAEARVDYERALALDPEHRWSHRAIGWTYLASGDPAAAEPSLRRALQLGATDLVESWTMTADRIAADDETIGAVLEGVPRDGLWDARDDLAAYRHPDQLGALRRDAVGRISDGPDVLPTYIAVRAAVAAGDLDDARRDLVDTPTDELPLHSATLVAAATRDPELRRWYADNVSADAIAQHATSVALLGRVLLRRAGKDTAMLDAHAQPAMFGPVIEVLDRSEPPSAEALATTLLEIPPGSRGMACAAVALAFEDDATTFQAALAMAHASMPAWGLPPDPRWRPSQTPR